MKNEDSFRMMELMVKMGFPTAVIVLALDNCTEGASVGRAILEAELLYNGEKCKTDMYNQEPDKATCDKADKICNMHDNLLEDR